MTIVNAIGVCGADGVGKTTFARSVQEEFLVDGQLAIILSFATMLKIELIQEFKLDEEILSPGFDKSVRILFPPKMAEKCVKWYGKTPRTLRELFQLHGSYRRKENPKYWLAEMTRTLSGFLISNRDQFDEVCFIFDDVRYQNEIDYIRFNFPESSKILKLDREAANKNTGHESENQELKVDFVLNLNEDKVGLLPIAARCGHFKGKTIERLLRVPRT